MSSLRPICSPAFRTISDTEARGVSDPCSRAVRSVPVRQFAGKYKYLFAASGIRFAQTGPRRHPLKGYALSVVRRKIEREPDWPLWVFQLPWGPGRVDDNPPGFRRLHLPQFHKNGASRTRAERVAAARRSSDICSFAIVAMFVGEHAGKDEKFLAQCMLMRGKGTCRRIPDERRRARDFTADAVEQAAFDAGLRRWNPGQRIGCDHHTL